MLNEILLPVSNGYTHDRLRTPYTATRFSANHLKVKIISERYCWKLKLPLLVAVMDSIVCSKWLTEVSDIKFRYSVRKFSLYF